MCVCNYLWIMYVDISGAVVSVCLAQYLIMTVIFQGLLLEWGEGFKLFLLLGEGGRQGLSAEALEYILEYIYFQELLKLHLGISVARLLRCGSG